MFIAFEGIEGCGKTTQSTLIANLLTQKGFNVLHTREPGGCALGDNLRKILLDPKNKNIDPRTELFLYLASRSQHVQEKILPAIKQNKVVIVDRFNGSTIAYQGYGRGMDKEFIESLCDFSCFGIWPNLTIVLDLPVEIGIKRAQRRNKESIGRDMDESRFEQEHIEFHERVRKGYIELCKKFKDKMVLIDARGKIEEVFDKVLETVKIHLKMEI